MEQKGAPEHGGDRHNVCDPSGTNRAQRVHDVVVEEISDARSDRAEGDDSREREGVDVDVRKRRRCDWDREEDTRGELSEADLEHAHISHLAALVHRVDGVGERRHENRQRAKDVARRPMRRQVRINEHDNAGESDDDAHVVHDRGPLRGHDPVDEDRGPQRGRRVEDAGEAARDSLLTPSDRDPRDDRVGHRHDPKAEQPASPSRPEERFPKSDHDQRESDKSRDRAKQEQGGRSQVLHGQLDGEERAAPDQGQGDERQVRKEAAPRFRHESATRLWRARA